MKRLVPVVLVVGLAVGGAACGASDNGGTVPVTNGSSSSTASSSSTGSTPSTASTLPGGG